jgi:hypothetical protein
VQQVNIRGLRAMANGRGPFSGIVYIVNPPHQPATLTRCRLIVGCDKMHRLLGDAPNVVAVVRARNPTVGWFWRTLKPELAEFLAKILEQLGHIREDQLEALGFVEERREMRGN